MYLVTIIFITKDGKIDYTNYFDDRDISEYEILVRCLMEFYQNTRYKRIVSVETAYISNPVFGEKDKRPCTAMSGIYIEFSKDYYQEPVYVEQ